MAHKKARKLAPRESIFLGNSIELKYYLSKKKRFFENIINEQKDTLTSKQIDRIKGFIYCIDDMLCQKYFEDSSVYTMREMIEAIKLERADIDTELNKLKPELQSARKIADDAFELAKGYLANAYETDLYNSIEQIELRDAVDEYQALEWEFEELEKCKLVLWRLLGVIHRPVGFFEKVISK